MSFIFKNAIKMTRNL